MYIVKKNADFNEGRGPMRLHRAFSTFALAETYVLSCDGIFGSGQMFMNARHGVTYYNGYTIEPMLLDADT